MEFSKYLEYDDLLKKSFIFILNNNVGGFNPYHNNQHLINVFNSSMLLCDNIENEITKRDKIEIGIASLFHDFNHSGGKLKDNDNIKIAIEGLEIFYNDNIKEFKEKNINIDNIFNLIDITEFPYKREPKIIQEKIIRDSDMLECYDEKWFVNLILGFLHTEMNLPIKDSIQNQTNFIKNIKFYTNYALYIHKKNNPKIIKQLNYFSKIF